MKHKEEINNLTHLQMAKLWRFHPAGHPYFRSDCLVLFDHFNKRFQSYGGMTPHISKLLGWGTDEN